MDQGPFRYPESVDRLEQVHSQGSSSPILNADNFDYDGFLNVSNVTLPPVASSSLHEAEMCMAIDQVPLPEYQAPTPITGFGTYQNRTPRASEFGTLQLNTHNQRQQNSSPHKAGTEGRRFLNPILNSFGDPYRPLQIIDSLQFPFPEELQAALERELDLQRPIPAGIQRSEGFQVGSLKPELEIWKAALASRWYSRQGQRVESDLEMVSSSPDSHNKKVGNSRSSNIKHFDSAQYYQPLASIPPSWGEGRCHGEALFQYNHAGQLNPSSTFTPQQIIDFIVHHPLNTYHGKSSGLTIWIQVAPADSSKRSGDDKSDKCRFECCPDPQRTIRKGDFRIAFDEQYSQRINTDPFHNAGYVHLYCIEKFIDFPSICQNYNVQPDTRRLAEGKNKMAITRDHASMQELCLHFIQTAQSWDKFGNGIRPTEYYEHTLCYKLTKEHLAKQPKHLQEVRERRGGNSIDKHLNNLDKYLAGRKEQENQRKAGLRPRLGGSKKGQVEKRKAIEVEDEDLDAEPEEMFRGEESHNTLDDNILERGLPEDTTQNRTWPKRIRRC
jgi:hypothetical protein